jgi:hypothetical protein
MTCSTRCNCASKRHTCRANRLFLTKRARRRRCRAHPLPAYFIDFETIQFAVPIWAGTRPYQQIPFQFSVHHLDCPRDTPPTPRFSICRATTLAAPFAQDLVAACGTQGPVFVYNAAFETTRIRELAERFADLAPHLLALNERVVDLLPIARQHYYHPSQQGSWSIKGAARRVPRAALQRPGRRARWRHGAAGLPGGHCPQHHRLSAKPSCKTSCWPIAKLDTWAMVRLWQVFAGRADLKL